MRKLKYKIDVINRNKEDLNLKTIGGIYSTLASIIYLIVMFFTLEGVILPIGISHLLLLVIPSILSVLGDLLLIKKFKLKEYLRNFSNAKKQTDLLEEETRYEMEYQKLLTINKVLKSVCEHMNIKKELIGELSVKFDIIPKSKEKKCIKDLALELSELESLYSSNMDELQKINIKEFLKNRFNDVRNDFMRYNTTFISVMASSVIEMMIALFPNIYMIYYQNIALGLLPIISPSIIVAIGGYLYRKIKNKRRLDVFNKINHELGENGLTDTIDRENERTLEQEFEHLLKTVCENKEELIELQSKYAQMYEERQIMTVSGHEIVTSLNMEGASEELNCESGRVLKKALGTK